MPVNPAAANVLWWGANAGRAARFVAALRDPKAEQQRVLTRYLADNADTEFGRLHRFGRIRSVTDYQAAVPLSDYDNYGPFIDHIASGAQHVLTREPVRRLVPSSGSTRAEKLIPYTDGLVREFNRGIGPWIFDLYRRDPRLIAGRAYWSVSPVAQRPRPASAVPVGFEEDSGYVGGFAKRLVDAALAVPGAVRHIQDIDAFRYATLLFLLRAPDLRLISVWHPSFLTLLLDSLNQHWPDLLRETADGGTRTGVRLRPDRRRAAELERVGPAHFTRIWPNLRLISCWADAHAATGVAAIRAAFPGVPLQAKGLIATECFVTLPLRPGGDKPLAVRSHFFEFLTDDGRPTLAHELDRGGAYSVVVTTAGGLYRYRLRDRVRVESFVGPRSDVPSLRFLGKEDKVCDLFGEKLSEGFAADVLRRLFERFRLTPRFAMLAPDHAAGGPDATSYTLFLEADDAPPATMGAALDDLLGENPHYRYCRTLSQLAASRVFLIRGNGYAAMVAHGQRNGQRIGNIKPSPLSNMTGWADVFDGDYLGGSRPSSFEPT